MCHRVGALLLGVEQIEDPLRRSHPGLKQVGHGRELGQGLGELSRVLDERLDVSQTHRPGGHPQTTDDGDHHVVQVSDEHHRRHDQPGDELRTEAGLEQLLVLALEVLVDLMLTAEDLDDLVSGERLFDLTVQSTRVAPLRDELLLRPFRDRLRHRDRDGDRHQRDHRQDRRDHDHHGDHADDGEQ